MKKENIIYRGTTLKIEYTHEGEEHLENFMLAEYHNSDYVFQLIQISGYKAGCIPSLIKKDPNSSERAISSDHLAQELSRAFSAPDLDCHLLNFEIIVGEPL